MTSSPDGIPDIGERMAQAIRMGAATVCPHPWEPGHGTGCMCGAPLARTASSWPAFAETWFGDTLTYPTGLGIPRPATGWVCSGCQRGFSPSMRECPYCPETGAMTMPEAGAGCLPGCCDGDDS